MISPRFATMLCFVQTDAVLDAGDRRRAARRVRASAPSTASASTASSRPTTPSILMASGASGRARRARTARTRLRFGEALDALLRQLALRMVADGEGARRIGRVHVRGGATGDGRARRARGRELAARQGGAVRRRPQLGPDRAGDRRRAAAAPRRCRSTSRSRASRSRAAARRAASTRARSPAPCSGDEVLYEVELPGRGRRGRALLLRPQLRLREDQRGVHDMRGNR